ncbi:hypothetical protein MMC16_003833 [Acarospora aff. strigata]|nr:hypothetical protein [Acarospora aff. strigata]
MEKPPGIQLFKVWDQITEIGRLELIKSLTQFQHQLAAIHSPAYGSLYFRRSITKPSARILLDTSMESAGLFCVGPAALAYSYAIRGRAGTEVFGPDSSTRSSKHNFPTSRSSTGTKLYTQHHPEAFGDLHKVSSSATKIYANIVAHRPPNFGDLDYAEKEIAMFVKDRATSAKAYEVATYLDNRDAYTANGRLTNHYESFSHNWERMGFPDPCPIYFTFAEIASHERECSEYPQRHQLQDFAKKYLDTDSDGWLPPGGDFAKKQLQNKALLDLTIDRLENRKSADEVKRMWPFPT